MSKLTIHQLDTYLQSLVLFMGRLPPHRQDLLDACRKDFTEVSLRISTEIFEQPGAGDEVDEVDEVEVINVEVEPDQEDVFSVPTAEDEQQPEIVPASSIIVDNEEHHKEHHKEHREVDEHRDEVEEHREVDNEAFKWEIGKLIEFYDSKDKSYYPARIISDGRIMFAREKMKGGVMLPQSMKITPDDIRPYRMDTLTPSDLSTLKIGTEVDVYYSELAMSWWSGHVTEVDVISKNISVHFHNGGVVYYRKPHQIRLRNPEEHEEHEDHDKSQRLPRKRARNTERDDGAIEA